MSRQKIQQRTTQAHLSVGSEKSDARDSTEPQESP